MIVKVKGAGVKLAGKWCFVNETAEIDKAEYETNKEYVEVLENDEKKILKDKKDKSKLEGE